MKHLCIIPAFLLFLSCGGSPKQSAEEASENVSLIPVSEEIEDWYEEDETEEEDDGYMFLTGSYEDPLVRWVWRDPDAERTQPYLQLTSITQEEFEEFGVTYTEPSPLLTQETDSMFCIIINNEEWYFQKEVNFDYGNRGNTRWSEYVGYYPDLKLHAVRSCYVSGDLHGFADLHLVDEQTAIRYYLVGNGDYNDGVPVFSPDNKYMAFIDQTYEQDLGGYCPQINVFTVSAENRQEGILSFLNETEPLPMEVAEIIWINDTEFVVASVDIKWEESKRINTPLGYYKVSLFP